MKVSRSPGGKVATLEELQRLVGSEQRGGQRKAVRLRPAQLAGARSQRPRMPGLILSIAGTGAREKL